MPTDSQQLVVNLDFSRLIERSLPPLKLTEREVTGAGLVYSFTGPRSDEKFWAVVAVYADETLASLAAQRQVTRTSVGPSSTESSSHHDLVLWQTKDPLSGSLLLRRLNVVIRVNDGIPWSVRLRLVEQIDQALQSGGPEVIHAKEVHPPQILNVKMPARIMPGERVQGEIEVANIAAADALFGTENSNVLVTSGLKPTLSYYAPAQRAQDNIVLIISTPGNLLSKKTVTIEVK